MSPATVGRIAGITLFGFLQLLEVERKTALIVVHAAEIEGRLYFDQGALVHAEVRHTRGLAAAYDILSWPEPRLEIFYDRASRDRTVEEPLQHILMEAARLLDERSRTAVRPAPAAPPPGAAAALPLAPQAQGLVTEAMRIHGALGAAVVDLGTGMSLASAGGADLVLEKMRALAALGVEESSDDVLLTVGKHYYLVRFVGAPPKLFLYLVLDREAANLGTARRRLTDLARQLTPPA